MSKLHKLTRYGKYRLYEYPVRMGEHVAEVCVGGKKHGGKDERAKAQEYLSLFAAAPRLLSAAKLAVNSGSRSDDDWNLRVRPLLLEAIEEAEQRDG